MTYCFLCNELFEEEESPTEIPLGPINGWAQSLMTMTYMVGNSRGYFVHNRICPACSIGILEKEIARRRKSHQVEDFRDIEI